MNANAISTVFQFMAIGCMVLISSAAIMASERHTLLSVTGSSEIIEGPSNGGFDISMGETVLIPDLQPCGHQIAKKGIEWAVNKGFIVSKNETIPKRAMLHLSTAERGGGFFEILYLFQSGTKNAVFSFDFIEPVGVASGAEYHPLVTPDDITSLQQAVRVAMACRD